MESVQRRRLFPSLRGMGQLQCHVFPLQRNHKSTSMPSYFLYAPFLSIQPLRYLYSFLFLFAIANF